MGRIFSAWPLGFPVAHAWTPTVVEGNQPPPPPAAVFSWDRTRCGRGGVVASEEGGDWRRMSEGRPVPRRESPWGLPEGDKREPKAHRCNDRAEDVVQACFEGNPFKTVPGPFKLFWQCMRSKPGEEPTEPYTYLQLDPPKRAEVKLE
uniref:Hexokinase n=1 Tax=Oryza punctata TaxID=4537 RepID=A0A0E0LEQ9_ORYPU